MREAFDPQRATSQQESLQSPEGLLAGKIAIITGGSRGIGAEIGREFIREGVSNLIVVSRTSPDDVLRFAELEGTPAVHILADVSSPEGIASILDSIECMGIKVDILVNNAGVRGDGLFETYTWEDFEQVMRTNLIGPAMLMSGLKRRRRFSGNASIINIGSVIGEHGNFGQGAYASSKAGLRGLTKTLATEFGPDGIRVNLIEPGFIDTDLTRGLVDDRVSNHLLIDLSPVGRLGKPEDVSPLVVFLASDKASFMTGGFYTTDGGLGGAARTIYPIRSNGWDKLSRRERKVVNDLRQGNS